MADEARTKQDSSASSNGEGAAKESCACQACVERRDTEQEQEKELVALRKCWVQLRCAVKTMYRDGLDKDLTTNKGKQFDQTRLTGLIHQLCERDAHQLYQRLESLGREHVMDMRVNLLEILVSPEKVGIPSGGEQSQQCTGITLEQTKYFLKSTLDSFSSFQETVRNMQGFIQELDRVHLEKFGITWKVINHHLFDSVVYQDGIIQSTLPAMAEKLGLDLVLPDETSVQQNGDASKSSDLKSKTDENRQLPPAAVELAQSFRALHRLMRTSREIWEKANKRMEEYTSKQMKLYKDTLKAKQRMLKEDLEFFKQQRRLLEKYVAKRSNGNEVVTSSDEDLAAFTETLRQLLSGAGRPNRSHAASPVRCARCQQRHCPCDECTISHVITCGLLSESEAPPAHVTAADVSWELNPLLNEFDLPPALLEELPALDISDFKMDMLSELTSEGYMGEGDSTTESSDTSEDLTDDLEDEEEEQFEDAHDVFDINDKQPCLDANNKSMGTATTRAAAGGAAESTQKPPMLSKDRFVLPRALYTLHNDHAPQCKTRFSAKCAQKDDHNQEVNAQQHNQRDDAATKRHMQHAYGDWEVSSDPAFRFFPGLTMQDGDTDTRQSDAEGDKADVKHQSTDKQPAPKAECQSTKQNGVGGSSSCDKPSLTVPASGANATPNGSSAATARPPAPTAGTKPTSNQQSTTNNSQNRKGSGSSLGGGSISDLANFLPEIYCETTKRYVNPALDKISPELIRMLKANEASQAAPTRRVSGKAGNGPTPSATSIKATSDGVTVEVTQTKHYTLDEYFNVNCKDIASNPDLLRRVTEELRAAAQDPAALEKLSSWTTGQTDVMQTKCAAQRKSPIPPQAAGTPQVQVGAEAKPPSSLNKQAKEQSTVGTQVELQPPNLNTTGANDDDLGQHCDCCYCEMFGDGGGFDGRLSCRRDDVRERLRLKLKRKGEESAPDKEGAPPSDQQSTGGDQSAERIAGHQGFRPVDELLAFIEGKEIKSTKAPPTTVSSSSKAAKRQRQRQKKLEQQQQQEKQRQKVQDKEQMVQQLNKENQTNGEENNNDHVTQQQQAVVQQPDVDVFRPRVEHLDEMDEDDRDVEMFKQFIMETQPRENRPKVQLDLSHLRRHRTTAAQSTA